MESKLKELVKFVEPKVVPEIEPKVESKAEVKTDLGNEDVKKKCNNRIGKI